jgi:hypothetical protein
MLDGWQSSTRLLKVQRSTAQGEKATLFRAPFPYEIEFELVDELIPHSQEIIAFVFDPDGQLHSLLKPL